MLLGYGCVYFTLDVKKILWEQMYWLIKIELLMMTEMLFLRDLSVFSCGNNVCLKTT